MSTLIIDTSRKPTFFSLGGEVTLIEGNTLSKTLFPALKKKIDTLGKPTQIAIGIGPGSYAGTRTGATVAETLSYAWGIPLIGFHSPLAYLPSRQGTFAYVGDAKMGELFVLTGHAGETLTELSAPQLIKSEDLPEITKGKDFIVSEKPLDLGEIEPTLNLPLLQNYLKESPSDRGAKICYLR